MRQDFEKISEEQFPPNPNEFDIICFRGVCKYAPTGFNPVDSIGFVKWIAGYISW